MLPAVTRQLEDEREEATALAAGFRYKGTRLPVAFIVFQTGNLANGGVESITQVLERLQRVRPIVITQIETPVNQRWREAGCEVHVWPMSRHRTVSVTEYNYRIYKLLRSSRCSVIHCNDILSVWHAAFGAQAAGAAVIFNTRDVKSPEDNYRWHWRVASRLTRKHLVLSGEMREELARRLDISTPENGREQGIDFIYSIVDPARLSPISSLERESLRHRLGIGPSQFAIGCVAAVCPKKAQLDLLRQAAPRIKQTIPLAKLYFIGDFDPEKDAYARLCGEAVNGLGLEASVSFVGYTPEVADWYRALDVVVVASRNEGLARCMIESLACGTPVVSFDVCSAREILQDKHCGFVVPQRDYDALVERLVHLAENDRVRQELGHRSAQIARELFDPPAAVRQYEELYFSVAGA
jgi:glycosyltransferase involved in cell wall biosynthesis